MQFGWHAPETHFCIAGHVTVPHAHLPPTHESWRRPVVADIGRDRAIVAGVALRAVDRAAGGGLIGKERRVRDRTSSKKRHTSPKEQALGFVSKPGKNRFHGFPPTSHTI